MKKTLAPKDIVLSQREELHCLLLKDGPDHYEIELSPALWDKLMDSARWFFEKKEVHVRDNLESRIEKLEGQVKELQYKAESPEDEE